MQFMKFSRTLMLRLVRFSGLLSDTLPHGPKPLENYKQKIQQREVYKGCSNQNEDILHTPLFAVVTRDEIHLMTKIV